MKATFSRALLFGVLVCVSSSPSSVAAAGFQITASVSSSNLNLKTTTVPAGKLAWFQGNRPDAITNLIQTEALPAIQHDLSFALQASAAFSRAAMLDTNALVLNVERAPLASGGYFSVAITTEGVIITTEGVTKTWGNNYHGEFGNGLLPQNVTNFGTHVACWTVGGSVTTTNAGPGPVQQSADTDWVSVAAGAFHALAIKADGSLWGWGDNSRGQLGMTNPGVYSSPVQIGADQLWNAVFGCGYSSFAIRRDGTLWAWGANGGSVLGWALPAPIPTPFGLRPRREPHPIGSRWSLFKTSVRLVSNPTARFGRGGTPICRPTYARPTYMSTNVAIPLTSSPAPGGVPGPWVDVTIVSPSPGFLALKADGSLWVNSGPTNGACNAYEWMAYSSFVQSQEADPASVYHILLDAGASPEVALGYAMTVLFLPFHPWAASFNFDFAAFASAYSGANLLHPYSSRNGWLMVRGNNALNRDGTIWVIGGSSYGGPYDFGVQRLDANTNWAYVSAGSVAAKADGSVWSWDGIANDSMARADNMVPLVTTQKWLRVKKPAVDVVALDTHSDLWTWGQNYYAWPPSSGQLGLGDYYAHLTPTQITPTGPWLDFAATPCFTVAVRQGGELWAWGDYNSTGTNVATPQRLNPERPWRAVFAHLDHAYALAADGTLWAMGHNASYNSGTGPVLGLNDTNHFVITSLQQLPGTNWAFVSPSGDYALALKTDGSL